MFDVFYKENILDNAQKSGAYFKNKLEEMAKASKLVKEIRGIGLMLGVELTKPVSDEVALSLQEKGFLIGTVAGTILRFLPPLIVTPEDIDKLCDALKEYL